MESSHRPWTIDDHPRERFFERIMAYARKKRIKVSESKIREIIGLYGNNLWKVLEEIDNSEER